MSESEEQRINGAPSTADTTEEISPKTQFQKEFKRFLHMKHKEMTSKSNITRLAQAAVDLGEASKVLPVWYHYIKTMKPKEQIPLMYVMDSILRLLKQREELQKNTPKNSALSASENPETKSNLHLSSFLKGLSPIIGRAVYYIMKNGNEETKEVLFFVFFVTFVDCSQNSKIMARKRIF